MEKTNNSENSPVLANISNPEVAQELSTTKFTLDPAKVKTKLNVKQGKHKHGRMKVTFTLGAEEANAVSTFVEVSKPKTINRDDYYKFLFFRGIESVNDLAKKTWEDIKNEHPEEFAKLSAMNQTQPVTPTKTEIL